MTAFAGRIAAAARHDALDLLRLLPLMRDHDLTLDDPPKCRRVLAPRSGLTVIGAPRLTVRVFGRITYPARPSAATANQPSVHVR